MHQTTASLSRRRQRPAKMCSVTTYRVHDVQFHCEQNNKKHHTNDIAVNRLIVRRGMPFQLTFPVEQPFHLMQDIFELTVETGPNASEENGTRSSFGFQACTGKGKPWRMQLYDSTRTSFTVSVYPPSNASIGIYSLFVKTGPARTSLSLLGKLIVLFNPWCEDDWVYMAKEEERQEYVMNEHGLLYGGSWTSVEAEAWDFGQFEDGIIDICLKVLDMNPKCLRNTMEDFSARCNPIYVGRVINAMINLNDDRGVMKGNLDSDTTRLSPKLWRSSVDILKQWFKTDCSPVKYGQCQVFAAVMCTVLRCLGIPCRVITNFESAQDTNSNLNVDKYIKNFGVENSSERVWDFHVWVEAWMKRPDISDKSVYDGWQVLDPTPQKMSEGVYCCGPAPVKAILEGHTNVKYDVPFVFAEVNADVVTWIVHSDGTKTRLLTNTSAVGKSISTKAVGSDRRIDITNLYKYPEGSTAERDKFNHAMKNMTISGTEDPVLSSMLMRIEEMVKSVSNSDIKLSLILHNNHSISQNLSISINAQTMKYNGCPTGNIYMEQNEIQLKPNEEQRLPLSIPFTAYGEKMLGNNSIKVSAIAMNVNDHREMYVAERNIIPPRPPLIITVNGAAVHRHEFKAEVMFDNPLKEPLKNISITLTGSGLLNQTEICRFAVLGPRQRARIIVTFWPYRSGVRKLLADLQCSAFPRINTSCNIEVRPFISI